MKSSLLIGSLELTSDVTITITTPAVIGAGAYYIHDDTALLSLASVVCALVVANTAATTCTATITQGRKVKLTADASFTILWGSGTVVRDALGYAGDLSPAATSFEATLISDLVWSAGQTESPDAPLGVIGTVISDTAPTRSGTGTQISTTHNEQRANGFLWRNVPMARNITAAELGGEAHTFYRNVLREAGTWNLWRNFDDVSGSSTDFTLVPADRLGPYQMFLTKQNTKAWTFTRSAGLTNVDKHTIVEIDAFTVTEVTGAA